MQYRNRIIGEGMEAPENLLANPSNWRTHPQHQKDALRGVLSEVGFVQRVIVNQRSGFVVDGHARVAVAMQENQAEIPVLYVDLTDEEEALILATLDPLGALAGKDDEQLAELLDRVSAEDPAVQALLDDLLDSIAKAEEIPPGPDPSANVVPEVKETPISRPGDIWVLGDHRVLCGDSTSFGDVEKLIGSEVVDLVHADPPYGMGKQADGVANDNIYREKLDAFQLEWWKSVRPFMADSASAYIWGNAPDLWRLWYRGGLGDSEKLELRNEIVWDKKTIPGMKSDLMTQFAEASERCLFFQLGEQMLGNINADQFPASWSVIQGYMEGEAAAHGITSKTIAEVCGVQMFSHWFTRSQFALIPEKHYKKIREAFPGSFPRKWRELEAEWDRVKKAEKQGARSYFDNAHDIMRDVWEFPRVTGEDRHGHATPKPVEMMQRVMLSSLKKGGLCYEPFGGSGSTLIGAEKTGRRCYTIELQPQYVDVIVRRWESFTGNHATLESDGRTFSEIAAEAETVNA